MHELHRLIEDCSAAVKVRVSPAKVRFEIGSVTLTSKLIDGTFPDYSRVIPQANDKEMKVSNAEFMGAVDRVSTIASERGRAVKLNIKPDKLVLSVNNPEGGSATEEIGVEYAASPLEIGFNARYLLGHRWAARGRGGVLQARRSRLADDGQRPGGRERALRADADAGVGGCGCATRPPRPSAPVTDATHWVERLTLTNFRNYAHLALEAGPEPQVLIGANGAGKTNLLEAVSLLAPGHGLRRATYPELARAAGDGGWAVAAHVHSPLGPVDIGTGLTAAAAQSERGSRIVRINGAPAGGSGRLAEYVELVWVTPALDTLFTGPASERRRFLDRLILCFDTGYRTRVGRFERAMQQRNRLLADGVRDNARFEGLELVMAETGTAIAAARAEVVAGLAGHRGGAARARSPLAVSGRRARDRGRARSGSRTHGRGRGGGVVRERPARRARARPCGGAYARRAAPLRPPRLPPRQGDAGAAVLLGRAEGPAVRASAGARRARRAAP